MTLDHDPDHDPQPENCPVCHRNWDDHCFLHQGDAPNCPSILGSCACTALGPRGPMWDFMR